MSALPQEISPKRAAPNAPQAVVIGSGFGGLAAAIRLKTEMSLKKRL